MHVAQQDVCRRWRRLHKTLNPKGLRTVGWLERRQARASVHFLNLILISSSKTKFFKQRGSPIMKKVMRQYTETCTKLYGSSTTSCTPTAAPTGQFTPNESRREEDGPRLSSLAGPKP